MKTFILFTEAVLLAVLCSTGFSSLARGLSRDEESALIEGVRLICTRSEGDGYAEFFSWVLDEVFAQETPKRSTVVLRDNLGPHLARELGAALDAVGESGDIEGFHDFFESVFLAHVRSQTQRRPYFNASPDAKAERLMAHRAMLTGRYTNRQVDEQVGALTVAFEKKYGRVFASKVGRVWRARLEKGFRADTPGSWLRLAGSLFTEEERVYYSVAEQEACLASRDWDGFVDAFKMLFPPGGRPTLEDGEMFAGFPKHNGYMLSGFDLHVMNGGIDRFKPVASQIATGTSARPGTPGFKLSCAALILNPPFPSLGESLIKPNFADRLRSVLRTLTRK